MSTVLDGNKLEINPHSILPLFGASNLVLLDSEHSAFFIVSFGTTNAYTITHEYKRTAILMSERRSIVCLVVFSGSIVLKELVRLTDFKTYYVEIYFLFFDEEPTLKESPR